MEAVAKRKKRTTTFGQRLRELREAKGLTQSALGEQAGMAYQAVSRLESGAVEPTWPTIAGGSSRAVVMLMAVIMHAMETTPQIAKAIAFSS